MSERKVWRRWPRDDDPGDQAPQNATMVTTIMSQPALAGGQPDPMLAERYGRGEIDDDEYRRGRDTLDEHRASRR